MKYFLFLIALFFSTTNPLHCADNAEQRRAEFWKRQRAQHNTIQTSERPLGLNAAKKRGQEYAADQPADKKTTNHNKVKFNLTPYQLYREKMLLKEAKLAQALLAKQLEHKKALIAGAIHTGCDGVALCFEKQFPCPHNKVLNRRNLALLTSSAIATTALHYTHETSQNNVIPKIALNACGKYVGIKTVDLTVWGVNDVTNWWLGCDMIDSDSKNTKLAQSVAGTFTIFLLQQELQKLNTVC